MHSRITESFETYAHIPHARLLMRATCAGAACRSICNSGYLAVYSMLPVAAMTGSLQLGAMYDTAAG